MKKFLVFTAILASSLKAVACSFYPYGDEVRFSIFSAYYDYYAAYRWFNYTSGYVSGNAPETYADATGSDPNIDLWVSYCNNKVPAGAVQEAVYKLDGSAITASSANAMVRYLFSKKDTGAIEYLIFAKGVEGLNAYYENPWERDSDLLVPKRNAWVEAALQKAGAARNAAIKSRYYFLAQRMCFYNKDYDHASKIYDGYFASKKNDNIIDYWSLYFRAATEKDPAQQSYYAALAFAHAPDKRVQAMYRFHYELPLKDILKRAKNNEERAAIYELSSMRRVDHALDNLEEIYKYNPDSPALGFLLIREINKLEDWIYTPYYTYFDPSSSDRYSEDASLMMEHVADDRNYAGKVLDFVNSVNLRRVNNPGAFTAAKAYLLFMGRDYAACTAYINTIINTGNRQQLQLIQALCRTAAQPEGSAVILQSVKPLLMEAGQNSNYKFIFAIGRELEYLGNTTDAALLFSKSTGVSYKDKSLTAPYYTDYYEDYFTYIDGNFTPEQLVQLIESIKHKGADEFSGWLYQQVNSFDEFYNLLGKKYIRLNRLHNAAAAFEKVAPNKREDVYLDENPFYTMRFTPDFIERRDSINLTAADITHYLINCIERSGSATEKDRDYYAFLAATCYYNMSQYGNSYHMRRYQWSSSKLTSNLPDNDEFFSNNLAKRYYLKAYSLAKTRKFRALCLRLAARCEYQRLIYELNKNGNEAYTSGEGQNPGISTNGYYKLLYKRYPRYGEDMYSSCTHYSEYFKARR